MQIFSKSVAGFRNDTLDNDGASEDAEESKASINFADDSDVESNEHDVLPCMPPPFPLV